MTALRRFETSLNVSNAQIAAIGGQRGERPQIDPKPPFAEDANDANVT
jgi:hypothetical protein